MLNFKAGPGKHLRWQGKDQGQCQFFSNLYLSNPFRVWRQDEVWLDLKYYIATYVSWINFLGTKKIIEEKSLILFGLVQNVRMWSVTLVRLFKISCFRLVLMTVAGILKQWNCYQQMILVSKITWMPLCCAERRNWGCISLKDRMKARTGFIFFPIFSFPLSVISVWLTVNRVLCFYVRKHLLVLAHYFP